MAQDNISLLNVNLQDISWIDKQIDAQPLFAAAWLSCIFSTKLDLKFDSLKDDDLNFLCKVSVANLHKSPWQTWRAGKQIIAYIAFSVRKSRNADQSNSRANDFCNRQESRKKWAHCANTFLARLEPNAGDKEGWPGFKWRWRRQNVKACWIQSGYPLLVRLIRVEQMRYAFPPISKGQGRAGAHLLHMRTWIAFLHAFCDSSACD